MAAPEDASHDWQTAFIWAFIVKFTPSIIGKSGMQTVMDLEAALHEKNSSPILCTVLEKFITNLKPGVKINSANVTKNLSTVIDENLMLPDLTVWDPDNSTINTNDKERISRNVYALHPFRDPKTVALAKESGREGPDVFWAMSWQARVDILRQLVDWQLGHAEVVRTEITKSYGLGNHKQTIFDKNRNPLIVDTMGQDVGKKRYWNFDDSPRIYTSANPFKKSCPMTPVASSKPELLKLAADLKADKPEPAKVTKASKALRANEITMAEHIENVLMPKIEEREAQIEKKRKKMELQAMLQAQAEDRTMSRTRRSTRKTYFEEGGEDDDQASDFIDYDENDETGSNTNSRRSSRNHAQHEWRGERRSTRVSMANAKDEDAADLDIQDEIVITRPSSTNGGGSSPGQNGNGVKEEDEEDDVSMEGSEANGEENGKRDSSFEAASEDGSVEH